MDILGGLVRAGKYAMFGVDTVSLEHWESIVERTEDIYLIDEWQRTKITYGAANVTPDEFRRMSDKMKSLYFQCVTEEVREHGRTHAKVNVKTISESDRKRIERYNGEW